MSQKDDILHIDSIVIDSANSKVYIVFTLMITITFEHLTTNGTQSPRDFQFVILSDFVTYYRLLVFFSMLDDILTRFKKS